MLTWSAIFGKEVFFTFINHVLQYPAAHNGFTPVGVDDLEALQVSFFFRPNFPENEMKVCKAVVVPVLYE